MMKHLQIIYDLRGYQKIITEQEAQYLLSKKLVTTSGVDKFRIIASVKLEEIEKALEDFSNGYVAPHVGRRKHRIKYIIDKPLSIIKKYAKK